MFIRTISVRSPWLVPLRVLPQALYSSPKLYALKMINLILLALLLTAGSLLTEVLILFPIGLSGWPALPNWLSLTLILLAISWCLGD
ncbi:hypothetical protein IQ270_24630 [Microcoleus sp. LEGE 07076]|nr:hypothetical protein [Microcoleus sp. LEGE 07076]